MPDEAPPAWFPVQEVENALARTEDGSADEQRALVGTLTHLPGMSITFHPVTVAVRQGIVAGNIGEDEGSLAWVLPVAKAYRYLGISWSGCGEWPKSCGRKGRISFCQPIWRTLPRLSLLRVYGKVQASEEELRFAAAIKCKGVGIKVASAYIEPIGEGYGETFWWLSCGYRAAWAKPGLGVISSAHGPSPFVSIAASCPLLRARAAKIGLHGGLALSRATAKLLSASDGRLAPWFVEIEALPAGTCARDCSARIGFAGGSGRWPRSFIRLRLTAEE